MTITDKLKTWWNDPKNSYIRWVRVGLITIAVLGIGAKVIFKI